MALGGGPAHGPVWRVDALAMRLAPSGMRSVQSRLLVVVAVPVLIASVLLALTAFQLDDERVAAAGVAQQAEGVAAMVGFQRALFDERIAAEILVRSGDDDTAALAARLLGSPDFPAAIIATDLAFAPVGLEDYPWALHNDARQLVRDRSLDAVESYDQLEAGVVDWLRNEIASSRRQGVATSNVLLGEQLNELEASLEASTASSRQSTALATAWFGQDLVGPDADRLLREQGVLYAFLRDRLLSLSSAFVHEQSVAELDAAIVDGIEQVSSRPVGEEIDFLVSAEVFRSLLTRTALFLDSADDSARQGAASAELVSNDAARSFATVLLAGILALLLAFVFTTRLARSISDPIRRLTLASESLRSGQLNFSALPVGGPTEIVAVTEVFNDVATNLRSLEHKLAGLSNVDLSNLAVEDRLPGPLGAALDRSVTTLTTSIQNQATLRNTLRLQANHDSLTGVLNRSGLLAALDSRIVDQTSFALLFVDLDEFKLVNDSYGHAAGDHVLTETARRITGAVRPDDLVARLGGDEFTIVVNSVDASDITKHADRLQESLQRPIPFVDGVELGVGVSIGIAFSDDANDALQVLGRADAALYKAKRSDAHIAMFDAELRAELTRATELEHELRVALRRSQLEVHYQPVIDCATNVATKVEALVRWKREDGEQISPTEFVAVAERSRLIIELDRYVLRQATNDIAAHNRSGAPPLRLSVNISGRHLLVSEVVEHVADALDCSSLDPANLIVEVTETALIADTARASEHLAEIRALGVGVSVDDFGTGFTSISQLRTLPIDELKIDRTLVQNMDRDGDLLQVVKDLANHFQYSTVAEGVETTDQAEALRSLGCTYLQGWLFARAMPMEELTQWIGNDCRAAEGLDRSTPSR